MPSTPRSASSRKYLEIEWTYPVHQEEAEAPAAGTVARRARRALTREESLRLIAGDDPRPLLVLRECKWCNGTDKALLGEGGDNEKTFLLSRWFHCVKLPQDVLEDNHPFRNLFGEKNVEHLFVSTHDGQNHIALESERSRAELWEAMTDLLEVDYKQKHRTSLKEVTKLLDTFDVVDARYQDLVARRDEILEEEGPKSRKLRKVYRDLAKSEADLRDLHAQFAKASKMDLRRPVVAPAPAEAPANEGQVGL
ncbi:MAG: hypothetical protein QGI46_05520 [Planctomycetota bacterium]|nr:hypothetical protein [Planctomycetota bacterium]